MPLQELNSIKNGKIALWHITEEENELSKMLKLDICPKDVISPLKRLEWI